MNFLKIFAAATCALLCAACGDSSREETLIIATEATFPPYEFREGERIVGIDPEIMHAVAKSLGRRLVIEDMSFDSVISAVSTGKADVAASGITVTEERRRQVNFSLPYVEARQVVIVPARSGISSPAELRGKRLGVQHGTTGDLYVAKNIAEPERFQNGALGVSALLAGKIDVLVLDDQPAKVFEKKHSDELRILPEPLASESYAFAVAKGNTELLAGIDAALREMRADGRLEAILKKYTADGTSALPAWDAEEAGAATRTETPGAFYTNFIEGGRWRYLADGLLVTLEVSFFAVILGLVFGFAVAVIRATHDKNGSLKFADFLCRIYLTVIRGTPVVVQLLIIYFVIFGSVDVSKTLVAIVAFGVNSGAYVAEIIRGGIMSIDEGQFEAGRSLGLSHTKTMVHIVLPQALKNVLPALGNEFVVLLKETSVAGYIALQDLTKAGDVIRSQTYTAFLPLLAVAAIYLAIVMLFSALLSRLEKRLKRNER
ncbi:MAG: ABC transporter permease subunit [Candidatus Spyradosoma sp.]